MTQALSAVPRQRTADLASFRAPFTRYLRAEGKAEGTIEKYLMVLGVLEEFLAGEGHSTAVTEVQKPHLQEFIAHTLEGHKSSTANTRFYALKAFFNYLVEDEEIRWHPMDGMKAPAAPAPPVAVLEADAVSAMLKACSKNTFEDRRDAAIIMMFYDTGGRLSELTKLTLEDVADGSASVMGKGAKPRNVYFGTATARVLDRYLRQRDRHRYADSDALWLGKKGPMTRWGIRDVLEKRARQAGVGHVHPHQFRHTFSHNWLADGGQETDLMRLNGWSSRSMVSRYAASAADARAAESYRRRQSPADKLGRK